MNAYSNPYYPVDPDDEKSNFRSLELESYLKGDFLHVTGPARVAVVAERGMGAPSAVRQFLLQYEEALRDKQWRFVSWDLKDIYDEWNTPIEFFKRLAELTLNQVNDLPGPVYLSGARLKETTYASGRELLEDLSALFRAIDSAGKRLVMVLYSFDRLPSTFHFRDHLWSWSLLRDMVDHQNVSFLLVSRRPLGRIEDLTIPESSIFCSRFEACNRRVGLMSLPEAKSHIIAPARAALDQDASKKEDKEAPWEKWMVEKILEWSGRNPYCLRFICNWLFERIWNQGAAYTPQDGAALQTHLMEDGLRRRFSSLYCKLELDRMSDVFKDVVSTGGRMPANLQVDDLNDLGYLVAKTGKSSRTEYAFFSPLFSEFLADRHLVPISCILSDAEQEVLRELAQRLTYEEIAGRLNKSVHTVKTQVGSIYAKLGAEDRQEAIVIAMEQGILPKATA